MVAERIFRNPRWGDVGRWAVGDSAPGWPPLRVPMVPFTRFDDLGVLNDSALAPRRGHDALRLFTVGTRFERDEMRAPNSRDRRARSWSFPGWSTLATTRE